MDIRALADFVYVGTILGREVRLLDCRKGMQATSMF